MRKIYLILSLIVTIAFGARGQQCYNDSSTQVTVSITPSLDSLAFFTPSSDSLGCVPTGWGPPINDTLYFTAFTTLNGFIVDSLTIDSINNLPPGLCWATNSPDNTFGGGQNGALVISGQVAALNGQYKLVIYVNATTNAFAIPIINLETAIGLRYYIRASCPGTCPALDTAGGKDSLFIPYTGQVCDAGIHEVSDALADISVAPDPFSDHAQLSFYSNTEGQFTLHMQSIIGAVVSAKEIAVTQGNNNFTIERNNLSPGIYILSISGIGGTVTKKVIIE